jgi:hypothetical protein
MNKRGLSTIVSAVLIILLVVGSVSLIWFSVLLIINERNLDLEKSDVDILTVEGYTYWDNETNRLSVHLQRTKDNESLSSIDFIFNIEGNSFEQRVQEVIGSGQKKVYVFCFDEDKIPTGVRLSLVSEDGKERGARGKVESIVSGRADVDEPCIDLTEGLLGPLETIGTGYDLEPFDILGGSVELEKISLDEKTLVIYNKNYLDGQEIAEYYANARKISPDRICGVNLQVGQLTDGEYFMGARNTIINDCICDLIDVPSCSVDNMDQVVANSPITHLVFTKGIPPRLTGVEHIESCSMGGYGGEEEPSLGHFMAYFLYRDESVFDYTSGCETSKNGYLGVFPIEVADITKDSVAGYLRALDPAKDKMVSYGIVEAMTKERTFDLIDRTIVAEQNGISGKFVYAEDGTLYSGDNLYDKEFKMFADLSSSHECLDYVENDIQYDYDNTCRLAINDEGRVPGELYGNILKIVDAGIYVGDSHGHNQPGNLNNGHHAFDGFYNMLDWHKSEENCVELCQDMSTQEAIASCRENSKDYFKEINTDCVGANEGLIGWQYRSWPVQYYGFWPPGWSHLSGGNGKSEKTAPAIINEAGNNYLHYGFPDVKDNPACYNEDGLGEACPEYIGINLRQYIPFNYSGYNHSSYNAPLTVGEGHLFKLTLKHRNPSNGNAWFRPYLIVYYSDGTRDVLYGEVYMNDEASTWAEEAIIFDAVPVGGKEIKNILLDIVSYEHRPFERWLDLDELLLYDETNGIFISDADDGNFDSPYFETTPGDYASTAIDRLGAIAWWGSSSHIGSGGHSFAYPHKNLGAFYSGRSLGESLSYNSRYAPSALIYGDPLYNPVGVRLFVDDSYSYLGDSDIGYAFITKDIANVDLKLNAFNGISKADGTLWRVDLCSFIYSDDQSYQCSSDDGWSPVVRGEGAVYEKTLIEGMQDFIDNPEYPHDFKFRVVVWNPGEEEDSLTNYAYFHYEPDLDEDSLSDLFEYYYFNSYDYTADDDPDLDGFTNLEEFLNLKNPMDVRLFPQCFREGQCPSHAPDCYSDYYCKECNSDATCLASHENEPSCVYGYCRSCFYKHDNGGDDDCSNVFGEEYPFCYTVFCKECEENVDCTTKYPDGGLDYCSDRGDCTQCYGTEIRNAPGCVEENPDCFHDTCVNCIANESCSDQNIGMDFCYFNNCVECMENSDCTERFPDGSQQACVRKDCVECDSHDQCAEDEYCWLNNTCAKIPCSIDSDCEDFDDCSLDECTVEGFCEFTRFETSEECYNCANMSTSSNKVGGFNLTGGPDINRDGKVNQLDFDIVLSHYRVDLSCNWTNDFCDFTDVDRSMGFKTRVYVPAVNFGDIVPFYAFYDYEAGGYKDTTCFSEDI